ncbi:integrase core domain-containing protein [Desulfonatronum parangueonense]
MDVAARVRLKFEMYAMRIVLAGFKNRVVSNQNAKKNKPSWSVRLFKIRPALSGFQKLILAFLHRISARITRYTQIRPKTLVSWWKNRQALIWARKSAKPISKRGRPEVAEYLKELVLCLKKENPGYSPRRIANMIKSQLNESIHSNTVRKILREAGYKPNPSGKPPKCQQDPGWKTFLHCHFTCGMDFKQVFNICCKPMYILNIINHGTRELIWTAATYYPTAEWVSQQMREAFPFDKAPKFMVVDRDSIFVPVVNQTLPNMGVKVLRIDYKCPWQNGIVERFNRTLQEDLLDYIIPLGETHLNRLLNDFKVFYNTARPHIAKSGFAPVKSRAQEKCPNCILSQGFAGRKLVSYSWLNGLHHSYAWV